MSDPGTRAMFWLLESCESPRAGAVPHGVFRCAVEVDGAHRDARVHVSHLRGIKLGHVGMVGVEFLDKSIAAELSPGQTLPVWERGIIGGLTVATKEIRHDR